MVGIPTYLATKQDWLRAFEYAKMKNTPEIKNEFKARLAALRSTRCMKVLKSGVDKPPEEQTPEDFESALDPHSPFAVSGLTETEIEEMTGALK